MTDKQIHKIGRIDQIVRDYFKKNPAIKEIAAKDLMTLFVANGIFNKDYSRPGLPIRNILRTLDAENKLSLLKHCKVVRNDVNRNWYFVK
jgi:hypothetical protein